MKLITKLWKDINLRTHLRFKREFAVSRHQPFGKTTDYQIAIQKADPTKLVKLIKLVGMLMQTKVYLFWKKNGTQVALGYSNG